MNLVIETVTGGPDPEKHGVLQIGAVLKGPYYREDPEDYSDGEGHAVGEREITRQIGCFIRPNDLDNLTKKGMKEGLQASSIEEVERRMGSWESFPMFWDRFERWVQRYARKPEFEGGGKVESIEEMLDSVTLNGTRIHRSAAFLQHQCRRHGFLFPAHESAKMVSLMDVMIEHERLAFLVGRRKECFGRTLPDIAGHLQANGVKTKLPTNWEIDPHARAVAVARCHKGILNLKKKWYRK